MKDFTMARLLGQKLWYLVLIGFLICLCSSATAQTTEAFDLPTNCVANDLEPVGAQITGLPPCINCEDPEFSYDANLTLEIYNKTGSTRTSFAFWAVLETTDSEGETTYIYIYGCDGPVEPGTTSLEFTDLEFYDINNPDEPIPGYELEYQCGTTLKITDMVMGWTPASSKGNECPLSGSDIESKCRYLDELQVDTPVTGAVDDVVDASCFGESDGSINITPSGGVPPYTFVWSMDEDAGFSSTDEDLTNIGAGTYTVTITDSTTPDNCSVTLLPIVVNEPPELIAAIAPVDGACYDDKVNSVSLDGSASGGTVAGDYTYSWSPDTYLDDASLEDPTFSNAPVGTYLLTLTVTDDNGCTDSETVNVEIYANPTADAGATMELTCTTTSVTLDGSGNSSASGAVLEYSWTGPGEFTSSVEDPEVSMKGTYTLKVTDTNNGCYAEDTVEVTENVVTPTADAGANRELTCATTSVTLNGTGSSTADNPQLVYYWTGPGEFTSSVEDPEVSMKGTYTLKVTDTNNGCYAEDTVEVTENVVTPTADAGATMELTCTTTIVTLDGSSSSSASGAVLEYSWTGPGEFTSSEEDPEVNVKGTYTLRVTDTNNGCYAEDTVEVTENVVTPTADAGASMELTCTTTSVNLNGSGSSTADDYDLEFYWTGPSEFTSSEEDPEVSVKGTYTLRVTDVNNGCYAEDTVEVTENVVTPTADAGATMELTCTATSVTLDGTGSSTDGGAVLVYSWTGPGEFTSSEEDPEVSVKGTYTLRVTDTNNGCYAEDTVEVTQDTNTPNADAGANMELTCTTTSVTLNGSGSSTAAGAVLVYSWTGPGEFTSSEEDPEVSVKGTYTLKVTDTNNGCYAEDTVEVTENVVTPTADAGATMELTCTTTSVTLDGSGSSTAAGAVLVYSWTGPGEFTSSVEDPEVSMKGTYTLKVTDTNNGCYAEDTVEVTENVVTPTADAGATMELTCTTTSVTLDGSGSSSASGAVLVYSWTGPGEFTSSEEDPEVSVKGSYTLRVTDTNNGCYAEDTVEVTENVNVPQVSIDPVDPLCEDVPAFELSASPSGGTWSGDVSAEGIFDPAMGSGTVTYTYVDPANGCENSDSINITVYPLPDIPEYQTTQADCLGGNGGLAFVNPGEDLYYSINGGSFILYGDEISLGVNTYSFRIRYGEDGCISDSFDVSINRPSDVVVDVFAEVIPPECETLLGAIIITNAEMLGDLNYTVTHLGTDTEYYSGVAYPMEGFTGLPVGTYFISALSDNGCISGNTTVELVDPICEEFEGCTLGYWKNHTDRWPAHDPDSSDEPLCNTFTTCTSYGEVFKNAPGSIASMSLLDALNAKGGGLMNLARQSVAALLNACSNEVNYEIVTAAEVIAYVNARFTEAATTASYLDMLNNAGCTMGGSRATSADQCTDEADSGKGNNGRGGDHANSGKGKKGEATSDISTFPIPFKATVNVKYDFDYKSDVTIEIFNMRGNHLRTYTDRNVTKGSVTQLQVDFAMKANQMYILKVKTDRETFVEQIVSSKK
ncbi:hypothetical protein V6B16_03330 [Salinimicrobium catena]|uniref:PKD domain-containing protein n=1 Tax=Salinimicrobium catena TaxID=390640 RepID=UPI002FE43C8B